MTLKVTVSKDRHNDLQFTQVDDGEDRIVYEWDGMTPPLYICMSEFFHHQTCGEGRRIPPWYYGLTYTEDYGRIAVFHLIPVNYIIRTVRWFGYGWGWLRTRQSWFDRQLDAAYARGHQKGYQQAEDDRWAEALRRGY